MRTDHQVLTTLLSTQGAGCAGIRIARWSARLLCFTYDIVYSAGSSNHAADCLSRLPLPLTSASTSDDEPELVALLSTALTAISHKLYWFPGMYKVIQTQVFSCKLCQKLDKSARTVTAPLQPGPWTLLACLTLLFGTVSTPLPADYWLPFQVAGSCLYIIYDHWGCDWLSQWCL